MDCISVVEPSLWPRLLTLRGSGPISRQYPWPAKGQPIRGPAAIVPASWKAVGAGGGGQFLSALVGLFHFSRPPDGRIRRCSLATARNSEAWVGAGSVRRARRAERVSPADARPVVSSDAARARAGVTEGRGRCALKGGWARRAQTSSVLSPSEVLAAELPFRPLPPWPADLEAHPVMGVAATAVRGKGVMRFTSPRFLAVRKARVP